jgi:hypothetical protein
VARYQFQDEREDDHWLERGTRIGQLLVRAAGFVLLLVGLWIALAVINEAWSLYRDPQRIESFAAAIERGSNLDQTLATASAGNAQTGAVEAAAEGSAHATGATAAPSFRLSYFVAWVIVILLLLLIGRLAIAAVHTGGQLVLYDRHIKRFARELLREAGGRAAS